MKNSGLKNEAQVAKIFVSGSDALPQTNVSGVRLFKESDLSDGIISGKLIRPKYNTKELKKSIDTTIFELLPTEVTERDAMVLKSLYDSALERIDLLSAEIEDLKLLLSKRDARIAELESDLERLRIELENEQLKANISIEQSQIANGQVGETTIDLSNAIQNSINEAIARVSLTARVDALLQENESLREQLFGLSAAAAAGGIVGGSSNFAVNVQDSEVDEGYDIKATTSVNLCKEAGNLAVSIDIQNLSTTLSITSVTLKKSSGTNWLKAKGTIPQTIATETTENIKLDYTQTLKGKTPTSTGWLAKGARDYDGKYDIKVVFDDGTEDSIQLNCKVRKNKYA